MTDRKEPPFFNDDSVGAFRYKLPLYDTMELFVETLTGTCFELRVLPFEAVISVKAKIQRLEGIPVAQQHLIWNNVELHDEHCLHDYGIAEGCTLKLVLAMRGGPINTRRVTMEEPVKDVADLMEGTRDEGWDRSPSNKQVTFVVYREGDQLSFLWVLDRGDGTLTPLSESLSGGSVFNVFADEEDQDGAAAAQLSLENNITMNKMKLLKAKMEDMNLNKKKSVKLKPRAPAGPHPHPHPSASPHAPSSTRHHHRLFRSLSQMNQLRHSAAALPPIADREWAEPSAHPPLPRRPPPSCFLLEEDEPWEPRPTFTKIRPPPKVSRLELSGARLMRDCVYPQLPPLCTRGAPDASFDPAEPSGEAVGLGLLEESVGLAQFGELSDPLLLDVSPQPEDGRQPLDPLPHPPSPLSPWTLAGRADGPQLGASFHIGAPSPLPAATSTPGRLAQPFDSSLSFLQPGLQTQSSAKPDATPPRRPAASSGPPPRLRCLKVESELLSQREARGVACTEPPGCRSNPPVFSRDPLEDIAPSPPAPPGRLLHDRTVRQMSPLHRAAASYLTSSALASVGGVLAPFGTAGTPTYHLPPVKAPAAAAAGSKKKSSKHCSACGKKTGLASSYECRCGHNFCASHRYAETHDCSYDYKSSGRRFLQESNPLISAPKLPKI